MGLGRRDALEDLQDGAAEPLIPVMRELVLAGRHDLVALGREGGNGLEVEVRRLRVERLLHVPPVIILGRLLPVHDHDHRGHDPEHDAEADELHVDAARRRLRRRRGLGRARRDRLRVLVGLSHGSSLRALARAPEPRTSGAFPTMARYYRAAQAAVNAAKPLRGWIDRGMVTTRTSDAEVVALDRVSSKDEGLLGPKASNLARLMEGGLSVPRGFVVTVAAWRRVLDAGLGLEVARALEGMEPGAPLERLVAAAARVRSLHATATLPRDLEERIRAAYRALGSGAVAVRSSATEEDQAHRSAAGVFSTALNVLGEDAVIRAVLECWASLHGETALAYRLAHGLDPRGGAMAVVVQAMVAADTAGVIFTRSRATEPAAKADKDVILIEAVPGRGRALVDGEANPERYEIDEERARHVFSGGVERNLLTKDELSALSRAAHQVGLSSGPP